MENKSLKENKSSAMPFRPTPEQEAYIKEFQQKRGFKTTAEAIRTIVDEQRNSKGSQILGTSIPEGCFKCDFKPHLRMIKGEPHIICILKIENKPPIIKDNILEIAQFCSQEPIHITMPTKEKYESKIETLKAQLDREAENTNIFQQKDDYYEELRKKLIEKDKDIKNLEGHLDESDKNLKVANRKLEPMQDLLTEKDTLNSKVSEMTNALLERDHKIAILETDNAYKDETIKKLSESELLKENSAILEENDALHLELAQKSNLISDYDLEIQKTEALREKERQTFNEVISKTNSLFRELEQFLPTYAKGYGDMQKRIQDFKGYLETMMTTPKDNILRGS